MKIELMVTERSLDMAERLVGFFVVDVPEDGAVIQQSLMLPATANAKAASEVEYVFSYRKAWTK